MLQRTSRPLFAVRAFILAPPPCYSSASLSPAPSVQAGGSTPSRRPANTLSRPRSPRSSTSDKPESQPKIVPYALTSAAKTFAQQVLRGELDFLPQAFDHLRQVVLEAQRRSLVSTDTPIVSENAIIRAMNLLSMSPQREHAVLHLAIFDNLQSLLHVQSEMNHPLQRTALVFEHHLKSGDLDALPQIYDHLQHLADATPDPPKGFTKGFVERQVDSWISRLSNTRAAALIPRILPDLPRIFGAQPTLKHHELVIKEYLAADMPEEAWTWLRQMEREDTNNFDAWQKPKTWQYDILLNYFAKRGDILSVRMLLSHMSSYATPSRISYFYLLIAILSAPTSNQLARLVAAVDEVERAGHTVHMRTLGQVAGRGILNEWVSSEALDVLRASQARGETLFQASKDAVGDQGEVQEPRDAKVDNTGDVRGVSPPEHASSTVSSVLEKEVDATFEPNISQIGTSPVISEGNAGGSRVQPPTTRELTFISQEIDTTRDATLPEDIQSQDASNITSTSVAVAEDETIAVSTSLRTGEHSEDDGQQMDHPAAPPEDSTSQDPANTDSDMIAAVDEDDRPVDTRDHGVPAVTTSLELPDGESQQARFARLLEAAQFKYTSPLVNTETARPAPPDSTLDAEGEGNSSTVPGVRSEVVAEDASSSDQEELSNSSQDSPTTPPDLSAPSDPPHVVPPDNPELGVVHSTQHEQEASTTGSEQEVSSPGDLPPTSKHEVSSESPPSIKIFTSFEKLPVKPAAIRHDPRTRRKYFDLFFSALRNGDLRDASKLYVELTALTGPTLELGGPLIKVLCRGHLLEPPPRPHVMQALRIYHSLIEVEKNAAEGKGFFDSANNGDPAKMNIGASIYNDLLRALASPAAVAVSSRDYGPEVYEEYASFATELLDHMEARGIKLDNKTIVSIILLRFRAAKSHQEAFKYYESMKTNYTRPVDPDLPSNQSNEQNPDSPPPLTHTQYKAILNDFAKISFPDAPVPPAPLWFSIADDMRARGFSVTVGDYTRFIGRIPDVPAPVDQLSLDDLITHEENIMKLLYACVLHVHKRLVVDPHISPDAMLLNTLMNVYQRLGAFGDALRVFNTIWLSGRMDHVTPVIIFDACGHAGQQNIAYMIWCMLVDRGWKFNKETLDTWVECLSRVNIEAACRFVCVFMGRKNSGYLSDGDTRPDMQTCLILLKLSWTHGQNLEVKERIRLHLPHLWDKIDPEYRYQ